MITLDNFENFVPYKIWMRGEEYYETDAVSELEEISPGEWTATVEGTDDYNVEISMDGNEIESWYCDCPYDGEICKHVVATLLAIRDNRKKAGNSIFSKMKIKAEETPVLEEIKEVGKQPCPSLVDIQRLLSFIDPQELSKFICEYASTNLEFKTALSNHFIAKEHYALSYMQLRGIKSRRLAFRRRWQCHQKTKGMLEMQVPLHNLRKTWRASYYRHKVRWLI